MAKIAFNKPPLSIDAQVRLLESRGLVISHKEIVKGYLMEIGYYRLSAYFLPFQNVKDIFNKGTTFEQVLSTYYFDRDLRLLVFGCIERIEVALRSQLVNHMSITYSDSHWHDDSTLFKPSYIKKTRFGKKTIDPFSDLQSTLLKATSNNKHEGFIKHYRDTYSSPPNPPSWMCLEILTIGELSYLYSGLNNNADTNAIAKSFGLKQDYIFSSWLHCIAFVRNICAHHARLWNKELSVEPKLLKGPTGAWISKPFEINRRLFYFICVLQYLLLRLKSRSELKQNLLALFAKYPTVPKQYLGIPSDGSGNLLDWENEPLWR